MAHLLHQLILALGAISSVYSQLRLDFVPPDVILQAGYPAGLRAFIPDFPGCEMFTFHGKLNSPLIGDEPGTFHSDILQPRGGLWTFEDANAVLSPGDILHYWTSVVKDKIPFLKKNLTWRVPDPNDAVDFLTPSTLKPPKPTPLKMIDLEMTTDKNEESANYEQDAITVKPSLPTLPEIVATVLENAANESIPALSTTTPSTTKAATTLSTTKLPTTTISTTLPTVTTPERPLTSESPKTTKPKKSIPPKANPLMAEDVEELTTPSLPFEKPIATEFPHEPPLFPFPPLFQRPFKPMMPPASPGFEICSNPWNFEEQPEESRAQRLDRQMAKLQCELVLFQRGTSQLSNNVESEINDLKKLIYGMVGRMARLESLLRTSPFG